ncbi:MAG: endo alpha-1,4 polygalactosaminidase [Hyphomicrobiaceae bacterium]
MRRSLLKRALIGTMTIALAAFGSAWLLYTSIDPLEEAAPKASREEARASLAHVNRWGYQLQHVNLDEAERSPLDLIVVDETVNGSHDPRDAARGLLRLKRKSDGGPRMVLSYLSIGEAEDFRSYWNIGWVRPTHASEVTPTPDTYYTTAGAPAKRHQSKFAAPPGLKPLSELTAAAPRWLGPENRSWRGNYRVRFWDPDWQKLIYGNPDAALDRLIASGFDGVYIDRADVFAPWLAERPSAMADMEAFVTKLAAYARTKRPGFLVIMQNAEELLSKRDVRMALDAVAKEDLLYGLDGTTRANSAQEVEASLRYLKMARRDGLPILVVEYLDELPKMEAARRRILAEGFIPYFGPRPLNALGQAG